VYVYFHAKKKQKNKKKKKTNQVFSLAGNVGGAASLMLGFCGVTFLEILFMIWDLSKYYVSERNRNGQSAGASSAVEDLRADKSAALAQKNGMAWGNPLVGGPQHDARPMPRYRPPGISNASHLGLPE
jgi:hypothetical protein